MRAIMGFQDVLDMVTTGYDKLSQKMDDDKAKEAKRKDYKALFILHQCVDPNNYEKISRASTSKEAWDILEKSYAGADKLKKVRLQTLRRQYELLHMEANEGVGTYLNRVQSLTNQMKSCGETMTDQAIVEKILRTLTSKFDVIAITIEETKDLEKLKVEELQGSLEAFEQRLAERGGDKQVEQALQAQNPARTDGGNLKKGKWKGKWKGKKQQNSGSGKDQHDTRNESKGSFKNAGENKYKGERKRIDFSKVQCYNCQKYGHFADQCHLPDRRNSRDDEARLAKEDGDEGQVLLMVTTKEDEASSDFWYLDTGCSTHMTGHREWFVNLDDTVRSKVKFADDSTLTAAGIGKVLIQRKDGLHSYISDVLYVPGMKSNLLSLGQLLEKGYVMEMENKMLKVFDNKKKLILKAPLSKNRTFKIGIQIMEHRCLATSVDKDEWLWHYRFGHLNFKDLSYLQKSKMVTGLPHIHLPRELCEECLQSKLPRSSFSKHVPTRAKAKLELLFSDVCGPIQEESIGGNRYFVTFIDDFTRKVWVYLLKRKSEVFETFKRFKALVEKQSERKIKMLRSDGGGEYVSDDFREFCEAEGIVHEVTPPYTPQHNGTAERKNRTLLNMIRTMLKGKNLPKCLWGEAAATAAYILNRCPSRRLNGRTPEEAWTGTKPNVMHLKIFGSICYKHVPDQLRRKLDDKAEQLILVGYHSTGGYKLLNPKTMQIMVSRDVVVDEVKEWNWDEAEKRSKQVMFDLSEPAERNEVTTVNVDERGRPARVRQPPQRLHDYDLISDDAVTNEGELIHFALLAESEPVNFEEAIHDQKWIKAMQDELQAIEKNQTWELVDLPSQKKAIAVKWVYKIKLNPNGEVNKYKARLVAKGFLQKPGVDFGEVFAPVARIETVRLVIAYAHWHNWPMYHLDVKSAFLNGPLDEEVYVAQPPGFEVAGQEEKVFKLRKALYGLKQAPRAWNKRIDGFLQEIGFSKCVSEHGVYIRNETDSDFLLICLYVDDLLVTGSDKKEIDQIKRRMMEEFEMSDLGKLSYFLGMELTDTSDGGVMLHQSKYAADLLKRFNMWECNSAETPADTGLVLQKDGAGELVDPTYYRQIVGSLRYLCNTRPDLVFSVGLISRFMDNPRSSHLLAAKRILRYVKGTVNFGVLFPCKRRKSEIELLGYSDSDWSGDKEDRKSTASFLFKLGDASISWGSKKESVVALSSCEAEYIAASMCACQALWLDALMRELGMKKEGSVKLLVDNRSAIDLAKHPVAHGRSKHIDTRFHFLRDHVNKGTLVLEHCRTDIQLADILTKPMKRIRFKELREKLNVFPLSSLN